MSESLSPDEAVCRILLDAKWKPFTRAMNEARGYAPHRAYYHADERIAAVVIERAKPSNFGAGDFAVSKRALDRLVEASNNKEKVLHAYIVLRERNGGDVLASMPAKQVADQLAAHAPIDGPYGSYWWVTSLFCPPGAEPDDAPF